MKITGKTKLMPVLAHPLGYHRASLFLNAHFEAQGKDFAAFPLDVRPEDLEQVVKALRIIPNIAGIGVTMPNKIEIIKHVDKLTDRARAIGAVNNVKRNTDGSLLGDNLDGAGFIQGLLTNGIDVAGKKVLQFGAGGAGRATAFGLAEAGAREVYIANRDAVKGKELADLLKGPNGAVVGRVYTAEIKNFDLIVNTTPLGMKEDDPLPFDLDLIGPHTSVCDIIVTPSVTKLATAARQRGAKVIGGQAMLDCQFDLLAELLEL